MSYVSDLKQADTAVVETRGRTAKRVDVLTVLKRCDEMGKDAFLRAYGFKDSTRYHLRHSGRSYPSKAILGVTLGLEADDFFGGVADTVRTLGKLGFHVRNSVTGEIVDALGLDAIRKAMIQAGFDDPAPNWPTLPVSPSAYFLSGSNRAPEIAALGKVGIDIGVTAPEIHESSILELEKLAGSDVMVFIDSGAFGEVKFDAALGEFVTVKHINHEAWIEILNLYERLARTLGPQLMVVAPDRVGSQRETRQRLTRFAPRIHRIQSLGARVMVAMQKGEISQAAFAIDVDEILGNDRWIPALPCKKAATTPGEVARFLNDRCVRHLHLLGLGVSNRQVRDYLRPFVGSFSTVSLDSCWLTANVGRNPRADGSVKVRRHTKACDIATQVLNHLGRFSVDLKVQSALFAAFTPLEVTS